MTRDAQPQAPAHGGVVVTHPWPGFTYFQRYAPELKTNMGGGLLRLESGLLLLMDPFAEMVAHLRERMPAVAEETRWIVASNGNHERACLEAMKLCPLANFLMPAPVSGFSDELLAIAHPLRQSTLPEPLEAIALPGFGEGETAIYDPSAPGALYVGDALIHLPDYGFDVLPAKYCHDPALVKGSLEKLLSVDFQRLAFAHGDPLVKDARQRVADLISQLP
jgi:hypothetical protein